MAAPAPHHRHQTSLEGLILPQIQSEHLTPEQRESATRIFQDLIDTYEPRQQNSRPYKQITLVSLTFRYARSEASKDTFLHFFFQHMQIPMDSSAWEEIRSHDYELQLCSFANHLMENFFLPLKAATRKTPQPSPTKLSELQSPTGITQRVATLRKDCLIRDRHRCVISRRFDDVEATRRVRRDGEENAQDDDGKPLKEEAGTFAPLEVAHIIPHSLMTVQAGTLELDESKKTAISILNMFDNCIVHLIEGTDIDRPYNAITLTHDLHQMWGNFEVFCEDSGQSHTYRIDTIRSGILRPPIFPVQRTFYVTDTRTIDPPSSRLLAVHYAIAQILHLSAAGHHIDKVLEDLEQREVMADGSTDLGSLARLRIQGVWGGQVRVF